MKCIKKSLSFILSLALVFNMFMGINISVYGYDEFIGFGIAGHGWENDTFALATDPGWYGEYWDMEVGMDQIVSLGFVEEFPGGRAVTAPAEYDKIQFTDMEDNPLGDDVVEFSNQERYWDDQDREDKYRDFPEGVYYIKFKVDGMFKITYADESVENEILINVHLPFTALYNSAEASLENLVALPDQEFEYETGINYYLIMNQDVFDERIQNITVNFRDEFLMGDNQVDWTEMDYVALQIYVPDTMVGNLWDAITIDITKGEERWNNETQQNEWEEWQEGYRFNFLGNENGLVISGADWRDQDFGEYGRYGAPIATDPTENEDSFRSFGKEFGCEMINTINVTLGIKSVDGENEVIDVLSEEDYGKLSIVDEAGFLLSEDEYSIEPATIECSRWDEELQEDVRQIFTIPGVCSIRINKIGSFRLVYRDGDYKSMLRMDTELPAIAAYGKQVVSEKFCLGSENVLYSESRNTFYIMIRDKKYDWNEWLYTIRKGARVNTEGDYDNIKVTTDRERGIIKVEIDPSETEDIEVRVFLREEYNEYEDVDGKRVLREREEGRQYEWDREDSVWFRHTDDELTFGEEAETDIAVVNAIIEKINNLPDSKDITVEDEDAIIEVLYALQDLTDEQLLMIEDEYFKKVLDCLNALIVVKAEKEVEDANIEAANVVITLIDELPVVDELVEEDGDAIVAAREAYENLTDDQKVFVDKETYAKLVALEKAYPYVEVLNGLYEAINDLLDDIDELESDLETAQAEIDTLTEEKTDLETQITGLNATVVYLTNQNNQLNINVAALEIKKGELEDEVDELNETIDGLNETIESKDATIAEKQAAIDAANAEIATLTSAKEELENTVDDLTDDNAELQDQVDTLTAEKEGLEDNVAELENDITDLNGTINTLNLAIGELTGQVASLEASIEEKEEELETASGTISDLQAEKATLESEKAQLAEAKATLEANNEALEEAKATLESEKAQLTEANATLASAKEELENAKADLEANNATLTAAKEALEAANTALEAANATLEAANAALNDEAVELSKELEEANEENDALEDANEKLEDEKAALETEKAKLETEKAALETEKATLESKIAKHKVGDVLVDSASNASYKILTLGSAKTMGTVEYTKILASKAKVTIPSTITVDGVTYQVEKIAANAFAGDKKLKTLIISEGIKEIGAKAFFNCKKLKKVIVRTSVLKKVGKASFKKVSKKVKVFVPSDKKSYKKKFKKGGIKPSKVK